MILAGWIRVILRLLLIRFVFSSLSPSLFSFSLSLGRSGDSFWLTERIQAPVALDIRSPMDLVYECFVKLGLRYICVLRDGKYAGMVS